MKKNSSVFIDVLMGARDSLEAPTFDFEKMIEDLKRQDRVNDEKWRAANKMRLESGEIPSFNIGDHRLNIMGKNKL